MHPTFSPPWYTQGLAFQCTECGKCCTGFPGYVWVTENEIQRLADFLHETVENFKKKYTRFLKGRYALLEQPEKNYDCIFLNGKQCAVYEARPVQCRTFPWWKQNLISKQHWQKVASECEGIREDAPIVPYEHIVKQMEMNEKKFNSNDII